MGNGGHGTVGPADLIERLTGLPPGDVATSCATDDLRAARLLLDEAIEIRVSGPRLRVVSEEEPAARTG